MATLPVSSCIKVAGKLKLNKFLRRSCEGSSLDYFDLRPRSNFLPAENKKIARPIEREA